MKQPQSQPEPEREPTREELENEFRLDDAGKPLSFENKIFFSVRSIFIVTYRANAHPSIKHRNL